MKEEPKMSKEQKEYIEKIAEDLPKENPTSAKVAKKVNFTPKVVKIADGGSLRIARGDIIGKDAENPSWAEEIWIGDRVFYILGKDLMTRINK